ncbi:spermidine synthase [Corynebacterium sp. MSK072]|uniref:spermidine synthase n=1 Tax=Corynebacterium rhinophilum TaxID=3050197 RepID=UPI00254E9B4A|nr:fused MFS/spermidine synthase [Corynebacterium sp. MSK072]MDK8830033.1 fused MFS/spermidine synthase [Corynebacterium sp. MSK072]
MGRKRAANRSSITGTYEISTGTAEVLPDEFRDGAYILHVNGVPSSHIVLGQPRELDFEYMRWIAAAVEQLNTVSPTKLRVTHLGGAGCSLPRYFADLWPDSRHTVVELDAKLGELVRELFDVPRSPTVKIRPGDARKETEGFLPASRDIIIRDVFAGDTTPKNLTTVEFFRAAKTALSPGGLYVANCGDHSDLQLAKSELAGLSEVFQHLAVIADPPMLKGRRYGNIILLASDTQLPAEGSVQAAQLAKALLGGAVPAHFKDESWTRKFFAGATSARD